MNIELDTAANALYLRLGSGRVAHTAELENLVVADYDEAGQMLGVEFVRAKHFGPFLLEHPEVATLPSCLPYANLDRGLSWEIETGTETRPVAERARLNVELNAAFVDELLVDPALVDRVPPGATIVPLRAGAAHLAADEALALARKIATGGKTPVLQPLELPSPARPDGEGTRRFPATHTWLEGAALWLTTPIELAQLLADLESRSRESDGQTVEGKGKSIARTA